MWGAAGCSQAVQVSHDHHGRLPKVNSQVVILRQGQVAQETLIWAQWGCEDLKITAVLISLIVKQEMTAVSRATHETTNTFQHFFTSGSSSGMGSSLVLCIFWKRCRRGSRGALVPWVERSLSISLVPLSHRRSSSRTADSS